MTLPAQSGGESTQSEQTESPSACANAGIDQKLGLAEHWIDELERCFTNCLEQSKIQKDTDPSTGEIILRARIPTAPDAKWGIHTGAIAHLLRSSLDNLAWHLAKLNDATPPATTAFVISDSKKDFLDRAKKALASISPEHQAKIESIQPYNAAKNNKSNPFLEHLPAEEKINEDALIQLRDLNNQDKHRIIPIAIVRASSMSIAYNDGDSANCSPIDEIASYIALIGRPLRDGDELHRFRAGADVFTGFEAKIAFDQECTTIAGKEVVPTLRKMHARVREAVRYLLTS